MSDCGSCRVNAFVPATHGRKLHSRIRALEAELKYAEWAWKQETDKAEKAEAALAAHHGFSANRSGWCPVCERAARRESGRLKG